MNFFLLHFQSAKCRVEWYTESMNNVIDNIGDNTLSAKLKEILPDCDRIDAEVGYFYFSGFRHLHNELKDKHIRILVGMDMDKRIIENMSALENLDLDDSVENPNISLRSTVQDEYIGEFSKFFNETDYFDDEESEKAFGIFLDKIRDGSLEIKKTSRRNHSKVFILHKKKEKIKSEDDSELVYFGSSNLSIAGLKTQEERNVLITDREQKEVLIGKFTKNWNDENNISLADMEISGEFIEKVRSRIWLYSLPDPLLMYYRVLDEYFSINATENNKTPHEITGGRFIDLQYQKDAVDFGIDRIKKFGGVIVADVVGLGKSIIASAIAHNLNYRTVIITPPALEKQWTDYKRDFDFNGDVYSTGKVDRALEDYKDRKDLLIILDEAHRHRNEDTDSYKALHKLCAGNYVVALSATPFNNDPKDIYALIKLFSTPGQSTIKTVENLSIAFHELMGRYKKVRRMAGNETDDTEEELKTIAKDLRGMIEPLIIRRSRLDIEEIDDYAEDLKRQGLAFSVVRDPEILEYELGDISDLYIKTLEKISPSDDKNAGESFEGVRYKPMEYLKPDSEYIEKIEGDEDDDSPSKNKAQHIKQAQVNVSKHMRRMLVRRFESSVQSFRSSLDNMIRHSEKMLGWYDAGNVPVYKKGDILDWETIEGMEEEERNELFEKMEDKGFMKIPTTELNPSFRTDLENDIAVLKGVKSEWSEIISDPKYEYFKKRITESLKDDPERKIIVFTEFSDTANYLSEKLSGDDTVRMFKYTARDSSSENKDTIRKNFDAGMEESRRENDFNLLIATDAISEGFNLHRAGTIVNYDIPYNPTRVIQRVGRINRINKKVFDELFIYNFFPTPTGEHEVKTQAISKLKMDLIHNLLGEDTKVLNENEELKNYYAEKYKKEKEKNESLSWDAKHRKIWNTVKNDGEIMEKIKKIPHRARIARKFGERGVVVFAKRNDTYMFAYGGSTDSVEVVSPETGLRFFDEVAKGEEALKTTVNFNPVYAKAKEHIFRDNTSHSVKGGRKKKALKKLQKLSEEYPPAKSFCADARKIIQDLDAVPNGVLKEIVSLVVTREPEKVLKKLQEEILPLKYMKDIIDTSERAIGNGKLVVLSEELLP